MSLIRLLPAYNSCLSFNGVLGDSSFPIANSAAVAAFASTESFTVAFSLKAETGDTDQRAVIGTNTGGSNGWEFIFNANSRDLRFTLRGSTLHDVDEIEAMPVRDGEWHRVHAVVTASSIRIYHNGIYHNQYTAAWIGDAGGDLYIGDRGTTGIADHKGKMQDIQIYDKALTSAEVEKEYFDRVIPSNLTFHLKMNEGSGSIVTDSIGGLVGALEAGTIWSGDTSR